MEKLTNEFMQKLEVDREINMSSKDREIYRGELVKLGSFLQKERIDKSEMTEFLSETNKLLIQCFIEFLLKQKDLNIKPGAFPDLKQRLKALYKQIMKKEVITKDYDERISFQLLQFQIDHYYEPKEYYWRNRVELVLNELKPKTNEVILDLGCGVGTFAYHCTKLGAESYGVDYSAKSIEVAGELTRRYHPSGKCHFVVWDASSKMPFDNGYFDKIVSIDFFEHITNKQKRKVIGEIYRLLKPGGVVVITTPNGFRELAGSIFGKVKSLLRIAAYKGTKLHFGLTNKFTLTHMFRKYHFKFRSEYFDINRPYLVRMPIVRTLLSANILFTLTKEA